MCGFFEHIFIMVKKKHSHRYYYAIVECDTVDAAAHICSELDGTELERSANVFDISFVPEGMTFENEPR